MVHLAAVIIVIIGLIFLWPFILGAVLVLLGLFIIYWKYIVGALAFGLVVGVASFVLSLRNEGKSRPTPTIKTKVEAVDPELEELLAEQRARAIAEQEKISEDFAKRALHNHYVVVPEHLERLPKVGKDKLDNYIDNVLTHLVEKWKIHSSEEFGYRESYQGEFLIVFLEALPTHDVRELEEYHVQRAVYSVRNHYERRR